MNKEQLLEQLESHPMLDRYFIADKQEDDNYTVIIQVAQTLYMWSEQFGIEQLDRSPIKITSDWV